MKIQKKHIFSEYPSFVQSNQHIREISASVQAAAASQHGGQPIQIGGLSITKGKQFQTILLLK